MINFKVGTYNLNEDSNFNFQLNRLILWDGGRLEDVKKVASDIHTSKDWKNSLIELGNEAEQNSRIENAIGYYRMSEFFMFDGDPDKQKYYNKATKMFYNHYSEYFEDGTVKQLKRLNYLFYLLHQLEKARVHYLYKVVF